MFSSPINGLHSITAITLLLITTVLVTTFYESTTIKASAINFLEDRYFSDVEGEADVSREEVEAASWLLPNPNNKVMEITDLNTGHFLLPEVDLYLDLKYRPVDPKLEAQEENSSGTDGVVPVQSKNVQPPSLNDHYFNMEFSASKPTPLLNNFPS